MEIATIYESGNNKKKVKFIPLGIYELLKEELGFRYAQVNKKGYFLENIEGVYKVVNFCRLKDSLLYYIKNNFESMELHDKIAYADFIEEYYKQSPLNDGNFLKKHLREGFTLSKENTHLILLDIDSDYSNEFKKNETIKFLNDHGFIETLDRIGSFNLGCPLYYKRVSLKKFLVVSMNLWKSKPPRADFDLWRLNVNSEKDFLSKKHENPSEIILGFNLKRDVEIFEKELK
jgi:hypothetical protein